MNRRTALIALLWVLAAAALGVSWAFWLSDLTYPGMPWQVPHEMADFRDTIWGPGRYLWEGGNPYDPATYLATHPWAQEFDPYAPAWLLLSAALALLPFGAAAAAYLVLGAALAVVLVWTVLRWATPGWVPIGTPLGVAFLTVWSPGRYALQNGGTLLVFLGWALVMRALAQRPVTERDARLGALGLALTLLKPQFGLPLVVVLLVTGRVRATVGGLLGLAVASAPVLLACVVSAGGPVAFLESIGRLLAYASSPDASTGLLSPFNGRIDLVGLAGRAGISPPGWVQLAVPLAATAAAAVLARRTPPVVMTAGIGAAVLLGLVHQPYDAVVLVVPFALGLGRLAARDRLPRWQLAVWIAAAVPVLHLHRITTAVLLSTDAADALDAAAMVVALLAALAVAAPKVRQFGTQEA